MSGSSATVQICVEEDVGLKQEQKTFRLNTVVTNVKETLLLQKTATLNLAQVIQTYYLTKSKFYTLSNKEPSNNNDCITI